MNKENREKIIHYIVENQNKFYRLAYSYTRNKEDSLDIVQNAICKTLEHMNQIRNVDYIRTWFYRVLVNESILFLRKNRREILTDHDEAQEILYLEKGFQEEDDISQQLNQLPFDVQTIIKLHYFEELKLSEIAEITGLNLNTVKAKMYRGLKKLKQEIEEESE
ncbi:MAG: sigma-70 family RNA polymerase sigma factor [Lachnospiraceae bacterium]